MSKLLHACPRARMPLAGLKGTANTLDNQRLGRPANDLKGVKGAELPGKLLPGQPGRLSNSQLGGLHVPESIPEAQVAQTSYEGSPRRSFRSPFGPDVETLGEIPEGLVKKMPSRMRPSMEARRKRLDLSVLQVLAKYYPSPHLCLKRQTGTSTLLPENAC